MIFHSSKDTFETHCSVKINIISVCDIKYRMGFDHFDHSVRIFVINVHNIRALEL